MSEHRYHFDPQTVTLLLVLVVVLAVVCFGLFFHNGV